MANNILYSEGTKTGIYALLIGIGSLLLMVAGAFVHPLPFVIGLLGIPVAVTVFSVGLYSKLVLTEETLQVGNKTLPLRDIDKTYGVLTEQQAAAAADNSPADSTGKGANKDLFGGAYGRPLWMSVVVIRLKNGTLGTIATQNRTAFTAALKQALGSAD